MVGLEPKTRNVSEEVIEVRREAVRRFHAERADRYDELIKTALAGRTLEAESSRKSAVVAMLQLGVPKGKAMRAVGCSESNASAMFKKWISDPAFAATIKGDIRTRALLGFHKGVRELVKMMKDPKTLSGVRRRIIHELGEVAEMYPKGNGLITGQNVQVNVFSGMSSADLLKLSHELSSKLGGDVGSGEARRDSGGTPEAAPEPAYRLLPTEPRTDPVPPQS